MSVKYPLPRVHFSLLKLYEIADISVLKREVFGPCVPHSAIQRVMILKKQLKKLMTQVLV